MKDMVLISRELLQQALGALLSATGYMSDKTKAGGEVFAAIAAMREALAAPKEDAPFAPGWANYRQGFKDGRETEREALEQPARESMKWGRGSLVTVTQDEYPALGGLFVQFWDGAEVAARVYANDHETLLRRCEAIAASRPAQQAPKQEKS